MSERDALVDRKRGACCGSRDLNRHYKICYEASTRKKEDLRGPIRHSSWVSSGW